jgi:hypothetical protein
MSGEAGADATAAPPSVPAPPPPDSPSAWYAPEVRAQRESLLSGEELATPLTHEAAETQRYIEPQGTKRVSTLP